LPRRCCSPTSGDPMRSRSWFRSCTFRVWRLV